MESKIVGNLWLREHFNLKKYRLTHQSYIGRTEKMELNAQGEVYQVYGKKYAPDTDTVFSHLTFALKYDDLDLSFLKAVFKRINQQEIIDFISASPSGKHVRKIGFLYEFLCGTLELLTPITGNYIDLLDETEYITGSITKSNRWKINNNLLGSASFCPIIRKTPILNQLLRTDTRIQQINYTLHTNGSLKVTNPEEIEAYYRYPDLTAQGLEFIQHYDELKLELQNIVDMPDKHINLMITFLHQNKGAFPNRRRKDFAKLTNEEIIRMEASYQNIFNTKKISNPNT